MSPGAPSLPFNAFEPMSPDDVRAVLAGARSLVDGAGSALKGRHVAVLCEAAAGLSADAVASAALALGATVVRLRPSTLALEDGPRLRETAHLLGRLYQLIGCEGLGGAVAAGLSQWAGVPVLSDVSAPAHPLRVIADSLAMQEQAERPAWAIEHGGCLADREADARRRVLMSLLIIRIAG